MLDNKQKLMIGGAVVVFLIIVVAMVMRSGHKKTVEVAMTAPTTVTPVVAPAKPAGPTPVPAGQLPVAGQKFVVKSVSSGNFLADNGSMVGDITKAMVFTFNSELNTTNEQIAPPKGQGNPITLVINFSGKDALVGSSYATKNGLAEYGVAMSGDNWGFAPVGYNPAAALAPQYYADYAVDFLYL